MRAGPIVHIMAAAIGIAAAVAFFVTGFLAFARINPALPRSRTLQVWLFPFLTRANDFVGSGWRFRKLQWLSFGIMALAALVWAASA